MLPVNRDTLRNPGILSVRQVPRWFFGHASGWPRDRIGWRLLLRIPAEFEILRYLLSLIPLVAVAGVWTRAALPLSAWHNFSPAEIACGGTGKLLIDAPCAGHPHQPIRVAGFMVHWLRRDRGSGIMEQRSLFGLAEHLGKLSGHGDPLEVLDATVDFEYFRGWPVEGLGYGERAKGGRLPFDPVSMFKSLPRT